MWVFVDVYPLYSKVQQSPLGTFTEEPSERSNQHRDLEIKYAETLLEGMEQPSVILVNKIFKPRSFSLV